MAYCIISHNTLYKTNCFLIVNAKIILSLVKLIYKKKSLYTNFCNKKDPALDKKNLSSINKLNSSKYKKILNIKHISFKIKHITFNLLR